MAMPRSVTRVDRHGGVTFTSNVDQVQYTLRQLIFRANYDVAKYLIKMMKIEARKSPSLKKLPKKRFNALFQYWVRKRENDLQIGIKANTWYGVEGELGTHNQPKRGILRDTVFNNIGEIRRIQSQYLSALSDENPSVDDSGGDEQTGPNGDES